MIQPFKKLFPLISAVLFLLAGAACGPSYNTNHSPPDPNKGLDETFPAQIGEYNRALKPMNLPPAVLGYEAQYGNGDIILQVIQASDSAAADEFFKQNIVPTFDALPTHSRGQFNGKWTASGKDAGGRMWYGWVNQNWIFVINASNKGNFEKVLGNFKFISR